jgi:hypothetical protein
MISRTLAMADGVMFNGVALVSVAGTFADAIASVAVAICELSLVRNSASELVSNPVFTLLRLRIWKQERFSPILAIGCQEVGFGRRLGFATGAASGRMT